MSEIQKLKDQITECINTLPFQMVSESHLSELFSNITCEANLTDIKSSMEVVVDFLNGKCEDDYLLVYKNEQVKAGYISEDGNPLKCIKCDSVELTNNILDQSEQGIMEMEKICSKCNQVNGHWAYGYWMP